MHRILYLVILLLPFETFCQQDSTFICRLTLTEKYQNIESWTEETGKIIGAHANYLDSLGKAGKLILAGRTYFEPGDERLFGIILFNARSTKEVNKHRDRDPAYIHKIQQWEIYPFSLGINYLENGLKNNKKKK